MNYWDLIKDAFWITLRNRYLWFFGFFAGVGARLTSLSTSQGAAEASTTTTSTGARTEQMGANAVIGVDVDHESIQVGQGSSMLMVSTSGTAVKL